MTDRSFPLNLSLIYQHGTGQLSDYLTALRAGRARASRCPKCGEVRLPPRFVCPEDGEATEAIDLPGTGRVAAATHTVSMLPFAEQAAPHVFVLVAMDGANNLMFGRMHQPEDTTDVGDRVRLAGATVFEKVDEI